MAVIAASRQFRRHFFTSSQTPTLCTRLQRAIYSGCAGKVQFLTKIHRSPYTPTAARISPMFLAIARDQSAIALHLLDLLADGPLFGLRYYFEHVNPQPGRRVDFWLHQPLLVAFGRDSCEYVDELARGMLVQPGERVPLNVNGLLVVAQRCNQSAGDVLWLLPRTRADGRRVARIVARCFAVGGDESEGGGDVTLLRHEWRGQGWCDAAAWMHMPTVWWRMYELFGRQVMRPLNVVLQLWQLADGSRQAFEDFLKRADIDLSRAMCEDETLGKQLLDCGKSNFYYLICRRNYHHVSSKRI